MTHPRSPTTSSPSAGRPSPGAKPALGYGERIALAAGSLSALGLASTGAEAAPILVNNNPVSLSFSTAPGSSAEWDVDGNGSSEFRLFRSSSSVVLDSYGGQNGRGLVGPGFFTDDVQALQQGFNVGPTLAYGYVWGSASTFRNAMENYDNGNVGGPNFWIGYDFKYGFTPGDNFFGFRFVNENDELLYGFGVINFDLVNGVVTIDRWAYESTPNTAVEVRPIADNINNIPEPGTASLTLLGLGAGGVRAWRARKKAEVLKAA